MKIAIVGSGISGLTAAYRLHDRHEITLFEANRYVGGHTHTVRVDLDDETQHVDTGFIVFNPRNYPGFTNLLDALKVQSQPTSMSFSVSDADGSLEYNGTNLNRLFAQRGNLLRPRFYGMIGDILRFGKDVRKLLASDSGDRESVEQFVARHGYGDLFMRRYLVPLGAALWSCPTETFRGFPIRFVGEFLANHFMLQIGGRPQWRVIRGGSSRYVEKMIEPFAARIHTDSPVKRVVRDAEGVEVHTASQSGRFDHVILACHADQALDILHAPSPLETELLSMFPYQKNEVYLHTDATVLPRRKLAWAAWNAKILRGDGIQPGDGTRRAAALAGSTEANHERAAVSYNMNILQSLESRRTFCVTLNEADLINPATILGQFTYHHPLFTMSRTEAVRRHQEVLCQNRTSFCGAYWGYGFHEDGVQSALRVVGAIEQQAASGSPGGQHAAG